jgi:hypothetical protein
MVSTVSSTPQNDKNGRAATRMEPELAPRFYAWLRESTERLAAPANDQIEWLRATGFHHDELALEHYDNSLLVPQLVELGYVSESAAQALTALDAQLDRMSGEENAALWTDEALHELCEWDKVRLLAKAALRLLPRTET